MDMILGEYVPGFAAYLRGFETAGNRASPGPVFYRSQPTYEDLKRQLPLRLSSPGSGSQPTYEDLKREPEHTAYQVASKFAAYLRGFETRPPHAHAVRLRSAASGGSFAAYLRGFET